MPYEYKFLIALGKTSLIETTVLFLLVRLFLKINKSQISNALLLFAGFIASFTTLPYVWFIFPKFFNFNYVYCLYAANAEIFAFVCESIIYYFLLRINIKKAILLSLLCNLTSFLSGLIF